MYTKATLLAILAAVAEARFGQEQGNGAISAISALSDLGQSGQAATLAGQSISFLLAAANPCGSKSFLWKKNGVALTALRTHTSRFDHHSAWN